MFHSFLDELYKIAHALNWDHFVPSFSKIAFLFSILEFISNFYNFNNTREANLDAVMRNLSATFLLLASSLIHLIYQYYSERTFELILALVLLLQTLVLGFVIAHVRSSPPDTSLKSDPSKKINPQNGYADHFMKEQAREKLVNMFLKVKEEETKDLPEEQKIEILNKRPSKQILDASIFDKQEDLNLEVTEKEACLLSKSIQTCFNNFGLAAETSTVTASLQYVYVLIKLNRGARLDSLLKYQDDISLELATPSSFEKIGNKIYLRLKKDKRQVLKAGNVLENMRRKQNMNIVLGWDESNAPHMCHLPSLPHLLIAGTTGSGKSVTLHFMISSLLTNTPASLIKFMLIDPKKLEFSIYKDLPQLVTPVITDDEVSLSSIKWLVEEMERRYKTLTKYGARNIAEYNSAQRSTSKKMPYIVLVVDELGDLMLGSYGKEIEINLVKLAQKSRAAGIHMLLSTQRPSAKVFTGLLKSNIPARLACKVASKMESRIILDAPGAETLLGGGDILFSNPKFEQLIRIQAPYISTAELEKIVRFFNQ